MTSRNQHHNAVTAPLRRPLAQIFLRKLIGAYVLLGVFIFGVQLFAEYRIHRQRLVADLRTMATTFGPGAASALWDFQESSLQSMVSGIGLQSDVVLVEIKGAKGSQSFVWHSPDGAKPSVGLSVEMPLVLIDRAGISRSVGMLQIASNEDRLWGRLRGVVWSIFQVGLALMLAMGVVVWLLVNRLVVRPLLDFSRQVNALGSASVQEAIHLDDTEVSEIATLQAGFNGLMHQVGEDQQRIEEQNANLERKVAERTQDLEAANKAKGEFLARMSHEIRTPMNAVIGLSQLTLRTELTLLQRDYLQKVLGSAQALLGIINDILDFSKIEAGKLTLETIDLDLKSVLDNLFNVVSLKADEKGLTLLQSQASDVPTHLLGDPTRLGQILLNLVGNAIKFTEKGEVSVSVTVAQRLQDQVRLRFCVQDSGIGITDAQAATLFQSFHQADGSVTRRFGGTGLGLAITKQLVELMHGSVWVESTAGQGSRFYFEVDMRVNTAAPLRVERRVREADAAPGRRKTDSIAGARVLLVEDNAINQLVARNFLEINGVQVDIANNGAEGVDMALHGDYALVLMDIQMPVMDGLSAARKIRATPGFEHLPIVAMTANAMVTDYQNSMDAGMNEHITKPIDQSQLTETLLRWIAPRPAGSVPAVSTASAPTAPALAAHSSHGAGGDAADLPASAELDTQRGLLQLGGAVDLYRKLLQNFLEQHAQEADRIASAWAQGDSAVARRLAHTVKGTAATLGAQALSQHAAALEKAVVQHDGAAITTALAVMQASLQTLCADLQAYFAPRVAVSPRVQREATPTEHAVLLDGLQTLAPLLAAANLEAIGVVAQLGQSLAQSPWVEALEELQGQIGNMDFAAAQAHVHQLQQRLGVQGPAQQKPG